MGVVTAPKEEVSIVLALYSWEEVWMQGKSFKKWLRPSLLWWIELTANGIYGVYSFPTILLLVLPLIFI